MKRALTVLAFLLLPVLGFAQAVPAPTSSTMSFSVGAQMLGAGLASQATPASDVILRLNFTPNNVLRSDNVLAPGANLQYYGAGLQRKLPTGFLAKTVLSGLAFYVDGTVGADRIVPPTGPSQSHIGFTVGGGADWCNKSGVCVNVFEVDLLHFPGAPWGSNAPGVSGGLKYIFGQH